MPALEIIGAPQSNYVWAVRMVCEEKGVPYEHKPERPHTPDVDAIHRSARFRSCVMVT
jgi:glutathione S-transferase